LRDRPFVLVLSLLHIRGEDSISGALSDPEWCDAGHALARLKECD